MLIWAVGWACLLAAVMVAVMLVVQTTGVGRHERYVRAKGTPITAWVMQASKALYEPGPSSTHAHVLYTFDDSIPDPPAYMRELVARLAKLKGTRPDDRGELFATRLLADESYRPFTRAELPRKLTGGREVYYAHIWVERELLPNGVLDKPFVQAIAVRDDDDSRALMEPYPAEG